MRFMFVLAALGAATVTHAAPPVERLQQGVADAAARYWQPAVLEMKARPDKLSDAEKVVWKSLDEAPDAVRGIIRATSPTSPQEATVGTDWLRWQLLAHDGDARYSYAYAHNLFHLGQGRLNRVALAMLAHARLVIRLDGSRCIDPTSPGAFANTWERGAFLQPVLQLEARTTPQERAFAILDALAMESVRTSRPPMAGLCNLGLRAMKQALESGQAPQPAPAASGSIGRTFAVDTSAIPEDIAPAAEHAGRRLQAIEQTYRAVQLLLDRPATPPAQPVRE